VELIKIGDTAKIRVLLFDGVYALTGKSPEVYIEKLSDGKYWNGAAWQVGAVGLAMTEKTDGANPHYEGVYEYDFTPLAADNDVYDWSVTFEDTRFRGRISSSWDHWTTATAELSAVPAATATPKDIITFLLAVLRGKVEITATQAKVYKDDEASTLVTSVLSDDGATTTKGEFS
jgi:hypothetical protein